MRKENNGTLASHPTTFTLLLRLESLSQRPYFDAPGQADVCWPVSFTKAHAHRDRMRHRL